MPKITPQAKSQGIVRSVLVLASMRTLCTHLFEVALLTHIVEVTGPVEVFAEALALRGANALGGYYNRTLSLLESN